MNKGARGALGIVVALAAFYGVKTLKQQAMSREPTAAEVSKQLNDLGARAAREHPGLPKTDALKELVTKESAEKLATQTPDQQVHTASNMFWGFYYMNTKARPHYCAQRGVDLTPFTTAFTNAHSAELSKAKAVYASAGISPEQILPQVMPALLSGVEQDMKDVTTGAQVPLEQACSLFNDNAEWIAEYIQLPPHVKQALLSDN